MTIVFDNQEMIVTHESGHEDIYIEADLQTQKTRIINLKNELDIEIAVLDNWIVQIQGSK